MHLSDLLILLHDATAATLAVFASYWLPNHTGNAKSVLVELETIDELLDNGVLFTAAIGLGNIARILEHC